MRGHNRYHLITHAASICVYPTFGNLLSQLIELHQYVRRRYMCVCVLSEIDRICADDAHCEILVSVADIGVGNYFRGNIRSAKKQIFVVVNVRFAN